MIKSLRSRFILIVMESFLVVLVLILLGTNLMNRRNVYNGIDARLTYLAESNMGPPMGMVMSTPQIVRGWVDLNSAGIMNETSYFIFTEYTTGSILSHQLEMLSLMTGTDASQLIPELLAGTHTHGNIGSYRYFVAARETPYKIVFMNCESEFSSIRSLWRTSLLVGFASFALVLLLVALLSRHAIRPFEQNIENQKRFISNASHELKTPLGIIMSDIDMQVLESGESEWLQNAQLQADHLALLIEQLTTYSLLSEKSRQNADLPVDFSALTEMIAEEIRPLSLASGQRFTTEIAADIPVYGNEDALRTMLSVLLDNAVKYTPVGGEISLTLSRDKKTVVQIKNSCAHVDKAELPHLFERFYRGAEHRADQDGHGLGLSIASEIAALYDGAIRAEAPDEHHILFIVELP